MSFSASHAILDSADLAIRIENACGSHNHQISFPQLTTSPISTLPPELLSEIFRFCLPPNQFPIPSQTSAPLLLTHINKQWRTLALALPDLWSAIHINYRSPCEDVPAVNLWLSHSKDIPLSVSLAVDFGEQHHQAIINSLCKHSKRWKHVRFDFRHLHCPPMYDLAMALANGTPTLSTFEFHARDISSSNITPITQLLSNSPQLRELTWIDDLADTDTLLALPLPRLTRLSLAMEYGSLDYLTLLDQCANLEHIRITRPGARMRAVHEPLLLGKLTSLNIAWDLVGVLENLVLPSLKSVRIHAEHEDGEASEQRHSRISMLAGLGLPSIPNNFHTNANMDTLSNIPTASWDPKPFVELVERSSCRIESLWVGAPTKHGDLVKCLKVTEDSLKSLTLGGAVSVNPEFVELLTPRWHRASPSPSPASHHTGGNEEGIWECFCPRLTELVIETRIPGSCSLMEMVHCRIDASHAAPSRSLTCVSPFHRLRLHYPAGHQDISDLRRLVNYQYRSFKLDMDILETRTSGQRGISAGRLGAKRTWMYRRKVCASR